MPTLLRSTVATDRLVRLGPQRPRLRRGAFTLVELLVVIAIIDILVGLLLAGLAKQTNAARDLAMQEELATTYCHAMHEFFADYGGYPTDIQYDQRLDDYFPYNPPTAENGGPLSTYAWRIAKDLGFTLHLSVVEGQPFEESTWQFKLCAVRDPGPYDQYLEPQRRTQFCIDQDCTVSVIRGTELLAAPRLLDLARAAEQIVPLLDAQPDAMPLVRGYVSSPDALDAAFGQLDTNLDGSISLAELDHNRFTALFVADLHTPGPYGERVDAQISLSRSDLPGDQASLFSYQGLRDLSGFYSTDPGLAKALAARLNAAEAAEARGQARAKEGALDAFVHLVTAQSGKALAEQEAHVLTVLAATL